VFFASLKRKVGFELRYALKEKIKQLEVLAADDDRPVKYVAGEGGELRVLIQDKKGKLSWHLLSNGQVGGDAEQPRSCEVLDLQEDMPEAARNIYRSEYPLWRIKAGQDFVRSFKWNGSDGLWLCRPDQEPKLIRNGSYNAPIVTSDGRWVFAAKEVPTDGRTYVMRLARIDLLTKQETWVESDKRYFCIVPVPASGKTLCTSWPLEPAENFLVDPATGAFEAVTGEFAPLDPLAVRPLQPITGSNEYWAAIPDYQANETRVGRYDTRVFKFTTLLTLPGIIFRSQAMWVDELENLLYVAYNGHLLRLPFPAGR
jgi:hypothetical protein